MRLKVRYYVPKLDPSKEIVNFGYINLPDDCLADANGFYPNPLEMSADWWQEWAGNTVALEEWEGKKKYVYFLDALNWKLHKKRHHFES